MKSILRISVGIAFVAGSPAFGRPVGGVSFGGLGDLTGGDTSSRIFYGRAMSTDGAHVVGQSTSDDGSEAFYWEVGSSMLGLGDLDFGGGQQQDPTFASAAYGITRSADMVVGFGTLGAHRRAVTWDPSIGGPVTDEGNGLPGSGTAYSEAFATENGGGVLFGKAGTCTGGGNKPASWKIGGNWVTDQGCLIGVVTSCLAFNVWVGHTETSPGLFVATVWTNGIGGLASEPLGYLFEDGADAQSELYDIGGSWAAGRSLGGGEEECVSAWRAAIADTLDPEVWIDLADGACVPYGSGALGITEDDLLVVGYWNNETTKDAVLWYFDSNESPVMVNVQDLLESQYNFDLTDWELTEACSVTSFLDENDNPIIVIAGNGEHDDNPEAWHAVVGAICPADYNHSGFVDSEDYNDFVAAFLLGDLTTDFDRSGFVDSSDFDGFVLAYENGCS